MKKMRRILALLLSCTLLWGVCGIAEENLAVEPEQAAVETLEPVELPEEELAEVDVGEPLDEESAGEPSEEPAETSVEAAEADVEAEESYDTVQFAVETCPDGEHELDYSTAIPIDEYKHGYKCDKCGSIVPDVNERFAGEHWAACDAPGICVECGAPYSGGNVGHEWFEDENGGHTCDLCGEHGEHWTWCDDDIEYCSDCGAEYSGDDIRHVWKDGHDDTGHWHKCYRCGVETWERHWVRCDAPDVCAVCGVPNTVDEDGDYVFNIQHEPGECQYDSTAHWQNCERCGEEVFWGEHYIICGEDSGVCAECGAPYSGLNIVHNYDYEDWQHDKTTHWHVCRTCKQKINQSVHRADCNNPSVCNACEATGISAEVEHDYDSLYDGPIAGHDANHHWRKCANCGAVYNETHYITCDDEDGLCECGERPLRVSHIYDINIYEHDEKYHWNACDACGKKVNVGLHEIPCIDADSETATCIDCGAVVPTKNAESICDYGDPTYKNDKYHTRTCRWCGSAVQERHEVSCTAKVKTVCEECGAKCSPEKYHSDTYIISTEKSCGVYCGNCKKYVEKQDHVVTCYSDGRCANCNLEVPGATVHHVYLNGVCAYCGKESAIEYPTELTLTVKETQQPKASSEEDGGFLYHSDDPSIASINAKGKITAKKAGDVTITVTGKTSLMEATCKLHVLPAPTKVSIAQPGKAEYTTDDEPFALAASVEPADAAQSVKWTSSDETVARVSDEGLVTLVGQGKATIKATSEKKGTNGKKRSASVTIQVKDLHMPASISITEKASAPLYVNKGETLQLHSMMKPVTEGKDVISGVIWSIPAKQQKYATIDAQTGLLQAKDSEGSVTVTVKTEKKGGTGKTLKQLTDTVKITVVDPTKPRSVKINDGEKEIPLYYEAGKTLELKSTIEPATATPGVKWSISSKTQRKIATVDSATGVVTPTGTKFGVVTVKVETTAKKSNKKAATATIKIAIVDPKYPYSVKITREDGSALQDGVELKAGQTLKLSASIEPTTATEKTGISWSISKSQRKYATVDKDGTVTGAKAGNVTVTVKTANGKKDTVKIKIVP